MSFRRLINALRHTVTLRDYLQRFAAGDARAHWLVAAELRKLPPRVRPMSLMPAWRAYDEAHEAFQREATNSAARQRAQKRMAAEAKALAREAVAAFGVNRPELPDSSEVAT